MSTKKAILETEEVYHVYNRSERGIKIFDSPRENELFLDTIRYYLQENPPTKFSFYRKNPEKFPFVIQPKLATIINYSLMPTHFHFTLRQEQDAGIKKFIQRISNSFAHYFNISHEDRGGVFERNFKASHVDNDYQLIHLSRYIHLNSVTSYLVENPEDYPYSSYRTYIGLENQSMVDPSEVISQFSSIEQYKKFVMNQKNYQRELKKIKDLILE